MISLGEKNSPTGNIDNPIGFSKNTLEIIFCIGE